MNYTQINFNVIMSHNGIKAIKSLRSNNLLVISSKRFSLQLNEILISAKYIYSFEILEYNYNSEPSLEIIDHVIKNINFTPDTIIAIGGGSVMDTAKAVKALFHEETPFNIGIKKNIVKNSAFLSAELIVIPTIIGSGSEVSSSAVLLSKNKLYLASNELIPSKVIYDLDFFESLSYEQKIFGFGDSIIHLIESCFSSLNTGILNTHLIMLIQSSYNNLIKIKENTFNISDLVYSSFWGGILQDKFLVGPVQCIAHNLSKSCIKYNHAESVSFLFPKTYELLYSINKNKILIDQVFDLAKIDFIEFLKLFNNNITKKSKLVKITCSDLKDVKKDPAGKFSRLETINVYEKFI